MSHTPHELSEEFPAHVAQIHALKVSDPHFAELADRYHEVNRQVHRGETDVEPMDDAHIEALRRERMTIKDQIWSLLRAAA